MKFQAVKDFFNKTLWYQSDLTNELKDLPQYIIVKNDNKYDTLILKNGHIEVSDLTSLEDIKITYTKKGRSQFTLKEAKEFIIAYNSELEN